MEEGKPLIFLHPLTKSVQALKETIEQTAEKDGIEVYDVENPEEYNQLIPTIGQSLTIACQPKKCAQCIQPLKRFILKNNVKVLLINSKNIPPKTLEKFRKIGLTEYIQEPVPPKTLLYKINLILRSLKKQDDGDEMEYHSKEEKQTFNDGDDYEDKGEAQKFGGAGHLKGKVHKNNHLKDGKDVFDDDANRGQKWEETQEDPYKNSKEYNAEQAIDSKTSGRLEGEIHNENHAPKKKEAHFDDDLYEQNKDGKHSSNQADQLGGALKGNVGPSKGEVEEDDDFDEDLFKSLEGVRKSSYKEEDKGGALRGDVSPTLEDTDNEDEEDDLFAALDSVSKKPTAKEKDQGGHYKGQTTNGLEDIEEDEDDEDLFAALESATKGGASQSKDQGGHYHGSTSPQLDDIEEDKEEDEDLFASMDAVKSGTKKKENDLGGHYQGEVGPEMDDIHEDKDEEEDLFASMDAHKQGAGSDKKRSADHDNELIDNEKGLERNIPEEDAAKQRDEDLFESLAQHGKRTPQERAEKDHKKGEDENTQDDDEDQRQGGSIEYEKKGDLGEQTIDYRNLDKQPEYTGGTKEKLEIKVSDAPQDENKKKGHDEDEQVTEEELDYGLSNALKKLQEEEQAPGYDYSKRPPNDANSSDQDHQLKVNQYSSNTKETNTTDTKAEKEALLEEAKDQKELDEALDSIIIPAPKDMDFFIRITNKIIDGDEIKKMTAEHLNEICDGTLIIYNLQNECIMGSEEGPDNFEPIKDTLKIKRKPSWNDDTFQSETLYYHCPIIENTSYNYFMVFFTTKDEVAKSKDIPKRIELCLEALKGNYKSGEDRMTTKVKSSKSGSSFKDSVGGLFKGLFGKGRT